MNPENDSDQLRENDSDQLRDAVQNMHGGTATLAQSVPVREIFEGKTVWEGAVHVFGLAGHPTGDARLRLVVTDRGQREAQVLRSAAYRADQLAS